MVRRTEERREREETDVAFRRLEPLCVQNRPGRSPQRRQLFNILLGY